MKKLKEILTKNRKRLIIAVSAVLLAIAFINIYFVVDVSVISNDECLWVQKKITPDSTVIFFDFVKVEGVTWNAGIRDGDKLLAIKDIYLSKNTDAQQVLNQFEKGSYAKYTVERNGKVFTTNVFVKKFFSFPSFAQSLLGFFWLLIGFVVLMAKPDGLVQKLFYGIGAAQILAATVVILQSDYFTPGYKLGNLMAVVLAYVWSLSVCYSPFLILFFFWNFPKQFKFLEKRWVKPLIFIIPGILSIILFAFSMLTFWSNTIDIYDFVKILIPLQVFGFSSYFIAFISLVINFRKLETREEKKPIRIILWAFALALISSIYTAYIAPAITDTVFNAPEFYAPIILVVVFPLAFAYSIFRYQLMDVSVVVKNTITYGAATLTIAAIYFLAIYVIGQGVSQIITGVVEYQIIIAGILFIIFALVFQSTKDKFQDFLTAKFYPEQFAYQKVLMQFSNEIATLVGLDKILDSMKETFVNALKIKTFGILIKNSKDSSFTLVRSIGIADPSLSVKDFSAEDSLKFIRDKYLTTDRIVIERQDFLNVFADSASQLIKENVYTIIPMIIKSKVVGFLLFGLKRSGSQFAGKDIDLLIAAANQAAIAIENARLYQTEAEKDKIEKDLELARRIQQGLLPKCIPNLQGLDICGQMIPAMQVGGDYFDLIPFVDPDKGVGDPATRDINPAERVEDSAVRNSKLFVVVGDVSGKGLSASLYMTKLQTMVQLACTPGKSPREILIEINKRFYESIERNWFITMTLALFDMDKRTVKFCRAGHMPIIASSNGTVNTYKTKGLGIGLERGPLFENTLIEEELSLKQGQVYAFFSDGITEAMNENYDLFGEEKLMKILRERNSKNCSEIMDEIWQSIETFRGNASPSDDMTMVLVKVS
jgi:serine phosphatase RsbU (regulator of sigma subunit)/MFS family permease